MNIFTNRVKKEQVREVQLNVLQVLSDSLACSFGPMGSNTLILKENMLNKYTKDGYSILQEVKVKGMLEDSVIKDVKDIVRNVITEFGDNSTSAVLLCNLIFRAMVEMENEKDERPSEIEQNFKLAVERIKRGILSHGRACTLEDIYNIAYTSSNGNEEVAQNMKDIYEKHGMDVFVDVSVSPSKNTQLKSYNGLTIRSGYSDNAYVNVQSENKAVIQNPSIYVFDDPIDNQTMMALFDAIIQKNIYIPWQEQRQEDIVPTVILCKHISRDMSQTIRTLVEFMYNTDAANRVPFLLVSNITDEEELDDIAMLCGCPLIKKFIDKEAFNIAIQRGEAPTPANVETFCGHCEQVESDAIKTKFLTPARMLDEDGNLSTTYTALLSNLSAALNKMKDDGKDAAEIGAMKRRINSLKANMVEYFVGGISMQDRDSVRDLVEDSVLNCRSAATYGVGHAANFEGYRAAYDLVNSTEKDDPLYKYYRCISDAYYDITEMLYSTVIDNSGVEVAETIDRSITVEHMPLNLRTGEFDGKVLTSIMSDVIVLDAISKIITIMFTCNQTLLQNPLVNNYQDVKDYQ